MTLDLKEMEHHATQVAMQIERAGHTAYFAGGYVRDSLMQTPVKDIDIATSATPQQILALFPHRARTAGVSFGVVLASHGDFTFDISTFRTDGIYSDGRHPDSVQFSSPEVDAQRRDFTVNGLFMHPATREIIDYVGGVADIQQRIIRAIGVPLDRFQEDGLRLMRAIRFATTKGFTIHPDTYQAICETASLLTKVAAERIKDELNAILLSPNCVLGIHDLVQTGLMRYIIPEIYPLIACEQPPDHHPEGDVFTHTMLALSHAHQFSAIQSKKPRLHALLSILLHDIAKPLTQSRENSGRIRFFGHEEKSSEMARVILNRLKYPNQTISEVTTAIGKHMKFMFVQEMRLSRLRRFMGTAFFEDELLLHAADCLSCHGKMDNYHFVVNKLADFESTPILPSPLITGRDLIERGLTPSPQFKIILAQIEQEQLEGNLQNREQALAYLSTLL